MKELCFGTSIYTGAGLLFHPMLFFTLLGKEPDLTAFQLKKYFFKSRKCGYFLVSDISCMIFFCKLKAVQSREVFAEGIHDISPSQHSL